tara:strand:+ start:373 stop:609 length:237 start_codon:yes stop_codon:yes gene_type:complete
MIKFIKKNIKYFDDGDWEKRSYYKLTGRETRERVRAYLGLDDDDGYYYSYPGGQYSGSIGVHVINGRALISQTGGWDI